MLSYQDVTVSYENNTPSLLNFSMEIKKGEIVALVGESGSGKTTAIRAAMGLLPGGGIIESGDIKFCDKSLLKLSVEEWRSLRGNQMSMIFQDSGAMLNPIRSIGSQFAEYILVHKPIPKKQAWEMGTTMLERMGLPHSTVIMKSYPFQLSGGMRQRVGIAMAMVFEPRILLADEPTSALDVTTQTQIVTQMLDLRNNFDTAILMVTHNLGVAAYMGDRILVMKDGKTLDEGEPQYILKNPNSTYTQELIKAVPSIRGNRYV